MASPVAVMCVCSGRHPFTVVVALVWGLLTTLPVPHMLLAPSAWGCVPCHVFIIIPGLLAYSLSTHMYEQGLQYKQVRWLPVATLASGCMWDVCGVLNTACSPNMGWDLIIRIPQAGVCLPLEARVNLLNPQLQSGCGSCEGVWIRGEHMAPPERHFEAV